jgi:hypothetical protein
VIIHVKQPVDPWTTQASWVASVSAKEQQHGTVQKYAEPPCIAVATSLANNLQWLALLDTENNNIMMTDLCDLLPTFIIWTSPTFTIWTMPTFTKNISLRI